jgi:hypothetical protein
MAGRIGSIPEVTHQFLGLAAISSRRSILATRSASARKMAASGQQRKAGRPSSKRTDL